ncbi:hypothetical protein [Megasphaera massiliensis]|nr:hypothetical protein [Megasphaera massiliensis]MCQ5209253.1 hypothetical protein [Megasphaera massiliensis]
MINVSMKELSWGITFFVTIIILVVATYKNSRWSILKKIDTKSYLAEFLVAILFSILSFVVMYINYVYCDNLLAKSFLLVLQEVCDIFFETIAISMWFQRFNVFAPKIISAFIVAGWCFVEVTQIISSTIIFLVISFVGVIGPYCIRTINRK